MIKTCATSGKRFTIDKQDIAFYQKIGVPTPTLCPQERLRRRLACRPKNMHLRKCDKTGKMCMSAYHPEIDWVKVHSQEAFWSEDFDATIYGRDVDFSRPFFQQFMELWYQTPQNASHTYFNENCEYTIYGHKNRDCYLIDESDKSQNCSFGYDYQRCRDMAHCLHVHDCEIGYDLIWAENCYNTFYSQNIFHCSDSAFLTNCRSCRNCLFCTNLRNKEYHLFNKPVSESEFQKYWEYLFAGKRENVIECQAQFDTFLQKQYFPQWIQVNCEESTGNLLFNCKNVKDSFCTDKSQDCRYCTNIHHSRDCYDCHIYEGELIYECTHMGPEGYHNIGVFTCWYSRNVFYCTDSYHLNDCFGCCSLKKKQFCILNKQYSPEEYHRLKDKIIHHMKETGEWGEFFPIEMSPYPYNETMAYRFFPLSKKEAIKWKPSNPWIASQKTGGGLGWIDNTAPKPQGHQEGHPPSHVQDLPKDITQQTFWDERAQKPFKFVPQEIKFYQKYGIPLPMTSPLQRVDDLFQRMGSYQLFDRTCHLCQKPIQTNFPTTFPGKVLCEDCYLKKIH